MLSPFHSPFQSPFRSPMRSPFKNFGHPGGRTIDFDCEDDEMNLNCFILMFDLLLKQVAEAWASFSSEVKAFVQWFFLYVLDIFTLTEMMKIFFKLLWKFPKEPEKINMHKYLFLYKYLQWYWHMRMDMNFRNSLASLELILLNTFGEHIG